jgi:hypothetical protein
MGRQLVVLPIVVASILAQDKTAQPQDVTTRQIWNTEFLKKRPAGAGTANANNPNASYRPVGDPPKTPVAAPDRGGVMLGVTLWRLRPGRSRDIGARLLVLPPPGAKTEPDSEVPERLDPNTPLNPEDKVRLSVEVPFKGYLYVIDREKYADGSFSDAFLIYPNRLTRQGDNVVAPGRVVEVPDSRDAPNYFLVQPQGKEKVQTAELISFLVTPELLPNLKIGETALQLDKTQYADWEKKWGVKSQVLELQGGSGGAWTNQEKDAGQHGIALTQDDPLPQTLYRVAADPGKSILLEVPLHIKQ